MRRMPDQIKRAQNLCALKKERAAVIGSTCDHCVPLRRTRPERRKARGYAFLLLILSINKVTDRELDVQIPKHAAPKIFKISTPGEYYS